MNAERPHLWFRLVNIALCNGLVPSGNITWANADPHLLCHIVSPGHNELTQWGWDKMATISQTFSNAFFLNKNAWIFIKISLNFVPKGSINNVSTLVQTMAWCPPSDEPLSEAMMVSLLLHIWVIQPQWASMLCGQYVEDTMNFSCNT